MGISRLTKVDQLSAGDLAVIQSYENGDTRAVPMSVLAAFLSERISVPGGMVTQYAAPSATGFSVALTSDSASRWLVLTPSAAFATGTVTLPAVGSSVDGQEVLITSSQSIATLTVLGNGASVIGAPTTILSSAPFRMRYDGVTATWYRVV